MWLATGLGLGLVVPAPGTVVGVAGLLLTPLVSGGRDPRLYAALAVALIALAVVICHRAVEALGVDKDPGAIVLDEIVALPLAFFGMSSVSPPTLAVGFVLFRLFDVLKPGPVRWAERLPGGTGVVADDLVAVAAAWLCLRGVHWFGWL